MDQSRIKDLARVAATPPRRAACAHNVIEQVRRYDRGSLRSPTRTAQNFLRADGYATRVGVFEYADGRGGKRRELRLPEEVFAKRHLDSYDGAPVTYLHPSEWVTPDNSKRLQVGTVTEGGRIDGDFVAVRTVIADADTIKRVDSGVDELSVGYSVDLDMTPGDHPTYGRYDAVQRNLLVNHLAIVPQGRAGREAKLRMDDVAESVERAAPPSSYRYDEAMAASERNALGASDFAVPSTRQLPINDEAHVRNAMARFGQTHFADAGEKRTAFHKITAAARRLGIDPSGFEQEHQGRLDRRHDHNHGETSMTTEEIEALKKGFATEKARADALAQQADTEKKRADDAEGSVVALTAENAKLRAQRADDAKIVGLEASVSELTIAVEAEKRKRIDATAPAVIHKMACDRLDIIRAAHEVDPEMRVDDLSNREIQVKVLGLIQSEQVKQDASDDFVQGMFRHAVAARRSWSSKLPRATTDAAPDAKAPPAKPDGEKKPKSMSDLFNEPLPHSRTRLFAGQEH